jgi:hypothetical protein
MDITAIRGIEELGRLINVTDLKLSAVGHLIIFRHGHPPPEGAFLSRTLRPTPSWATRTQGGVVQLAGRFGFAGPLTRAARW